MQGQRIAPTTNLVNLILTFIGIIPKIYFLENFIKVHHIFTFPLFRTQRDVLDDWGLIFVRLLWLLWQSWRVVFPALSLAARPTAGLVSRRFLLLAVWPHAPQVFGRRLLLLATLLPLWFSAPASHLAKLIDFQLILKKECQFEFVCSAVVL